MQLQTERQKTAAKKKIQIKTEASKKLEDNHKMLISAKLIERMVCQNLYDDIVYGRINDCRKSAVSARFCDHLVTISLPK